ncbi:hypothetical protein AVEN_236496-1 [Araneus ventricosus]|uniref:Uncharacterized protein n=1 Tax=Araneus ventricosus TaxID=182803 RepID=A0A4Y2NUU7_ARAVE|nr:hypothetical protein AVEN_236496-1 [Araneus ventricosus]
MASIVLWIFIGETDINEPSFKLKTKNLSSAMFSFIGEVDGRASPSGTILREPIEIQEFSSRYARRPPWNPTREGSCQLWIFPASVLTLEVAPGYSITAPATLALQQQVLVPKEQTTSRLTGAG